VRAQLSGAVSTFATYSFLEARIADTDDAGNRQLFAGNRFRLAPKHQASLGATLEQGLGTLGRLSVTPTASYRSHVFFEERNDAIAGLPIEQDGYTLVNLRVALATRDARWELAATARTCSASSS
jgi:outer membrane receptor protein involved in Fe transport